MKKKRPESASSPATVRRGPGRPPTERGAYNPLPIRRIGRLSDEDWRQIQENYAASGERTFTAWARGRLICRAVVMTKSAEKID